LRGLAAPGKRTYVIARLDAQRPRATCSPLPASTDPAMLTRRQGRPADMCNNAIARVPPLRAFTTVWEELAP